MNCWGIGKSIGFRHVFWGLHVWKQLILSELCEALEPSSQAAKGPVFFFKSSVFFRVLRCAAPVHSVFRLAARTIPKRHPLETFCTMSTARPSVSLYQWKIYRMPWFLPLNVVVKSVKFPLNQSNDCSLVLSVLMIFLVIHWILIYITLWLFNIAIGNCPCIIFEVFMKSYIQNLFALFSSLEYAEILVCSIFNYHMMFGTEMDLSDS